MFIGVTMVTEEARNFKFILEIEKQLAIWDFKDFKHSKRTELDKAWTAVTHDVNITSIKRLDVRYHTIFFLFFPSWYG